MDGERLLFHARRLLRLNRENAGRLRRCEPGGPSCASARPDDYADRFLPEIMARFSRSNPRVELSVICEPTVNLCRNRCVAGSSTIALVTHDDDKGLSEVVRREPLLWVGSINHAVHEEPIVPLAVGRPTCLWRRAACELLDETGREYRILFHQLGRQLSSFASVMSGLAVSVLARMRAQARHGYPRRRPTVSASLPECRIGIMRGHTSQPEIVDALSPPHLW